MVVFVEHIICLIMGTFILVTLHTLDRILSMAEASFHMIYSKLHPAVPQSICEDIPPLRVLLCLVSI